MDKEFVEFLEANRSAKKGSVTLVDSEYNGFADISTGGILDGCETNGELRLKGDTEGLEDGYTPCNVLDITREVSCSADCLRKRDDGGVTVKLKKVK